MTKKIKMKHEYKYRNGDPARVLCVDSGASEYPVISVNNDGGGHHRHTKKGKYLHSFDPACKHAYDLIRTKKPHIIEMGRQYKYRNGEIAYILSTSIIRTSLPYFTVLARNGVGRQTAHTRTGRHYSATVDHAHDLVLVE